MYTHISKFVTIKRTMCLVIHIFFYVYPYFKICNYKKRNYVNNKTHIFYVYPYL